MRFLIIFLFFLFSAPSLAKIHFEPYVGYAVTFTGDKAVNIPESSVSTSIQKVKEGQFYHGPSGGARIGYSRLGLAFGLDFTLSQVTSPTHSLTPVLFGLFASYKLPLFFRVYASLIPGHLGLPLSYIQKNPRYPGGESAKCNAWGGKLGISYLSMPFLSVNFEYQPIQMSGPTNCRNLLSHSLIASINFIL
ncbi:MAG: hypothetical protein OXB86_04060 [Bdellovibrionales bacterium]|nr:hypothetical protein [Bdellovibrionales bacterium]